MQATARSLTAEVLAWDTAHFGLPVGRIEVGPDDSGLPQALARAADDGLRLVYVSTPPDFAMTADLLHRFDGLKVDDRLVFSSDLDGGPPLRASESVAVAEAPRDDPSPAMIELRGPPANFLVSRSILAFASTTFIVSTRSGSLAVAVVRRRTWCSSPRPPTRPTTRWAS